MRQQLVLLLSTSALLLSVSAFAHEPSEHTAASQRPDCSAMQNMDHSKMDMNDPLMQAIMQKCMNAHNQGKHTHPSQDHATHESTKESTKPEK